MALSNRQRPELDADRLETIRAALAEKLRHRYQQSESFIAEVVDELVDQAYIEYAERSPEKRDEIKSLVGYLITVAERRALDRIRREGREFNGEGAEIAIEHAADDGPSVEALAARGIEATELHAAVAELGDEQRRALVHYFWEELPTREAAQAMGLSTMTFCRRRDAALSFLRERFGIADGDPLQRHLGLEAGFAAWVGFVAGHGASLLGALPDPSAAAAAAYRAVTTSIAKARDFLWSMGSSCRSAAERAGEGMRWIAVRGGSKTRDLPVRLSSDGGAGGLPLAAGRDAAKTAGVCAAAALAAICGASVVGIGPVAGLLHPGSTTRHGPTRPRVAVVNARRTTPSNSESPHLSPARPASTGETSRPAGDRGRKERQVRRDRQGRKYTLAAERAAGSQELTGASGGTVEEVTPTTESSYVGEPASAEPYVGEPGGGGQSAAETAAGSQFGP